MTKITRLKAGFAVGIVVMLANAIIPYQTFAWLAVANESAEHAEDVIEAANELLSTIKDAETGHRGFVITGRREFLKPYETALRDVRPQLLRLQSLISSRPETHRSIASLNRLVEEKIREMERLIDMRRDQGLEPSARVLGEGKGRQLMDGIRAGVAGLVGAEQSRLIGLKRDQERMSALTAYALALVSFLDLLVLGIVYYLVFRTIAERTAVENELRVMGEQLKSGVDTLAARNREMEILHHMSDALQSSATMAEAHAMIAKFGGQLFPDRAGTLYLLHPSRDLVEAACGWGERPSRPETFEPEQCWALRRGQPHVMNEPARDVICSHVEKAVRAAPYACVPLIAQGQAMGLVHIEAQPGAERRQVFDETLRVVALSFAEQASLSLSNMRLRETLRQQSITDALTGLYNRRYLDETLRRELLRAGRAKTPVSVIMLDVDHFKRFNDTHGHEAGDVVLRALAGLMQKHARAGDILCRFGGEEFAMIMPEMSVEVAVGRAQRLCDAARLLDVEYGAQPMRITISAGVANFPAHATEGTALLQAADAALYAAKNGGRDRVALAEAGPPSR